MFRQQARFVLALLCLVSAWALKDPATGISFPGAHKDTSLIGVGVRKKGPLKLYSVAMYAQAALKEKLGGISKSDKKAALAALQSAAGEGPCNFLLEMNFKVGAEKIASGLANSVIPRHSGSNADVESLKNMILGGVSANCKGGAAVKGTQLEFMCSPETGVDVSVNGKEQGNVPSPALAKAFCDVYLDDKAVSPALVNSCIETNCAP